MKPEARATRSVAKSTKVTAERSPQASKTLLDLEKAVANLQNAARYINTLADDLEGARSPTSHIRLTANIPKFVAKIRKRHGNTEEEEEDLSNLTDEDVEAAWILTRFQADASANEESSTSESEKSPSPNASFFGDDESELDEAIVVSAFIRDIEDPKKLREGDLPRDAEDNS